MDASLEEMRDPGMEDRLWCPDAPDHRHEYRTDFWSCRWCDREMTAPGVAVPSAQLQWLEQNAARMGEYAR